MILIYGIDQVLLATRRILLTRQGFRVIVAQTIEELETSIREFEPSVAVYCSSLTVENKDSAIALARRLRPAMKNLVVEILPVAPTSNEVDLLVDGLSGPNAFIKAVAKLTQ